MISREPLVAGCPHCGSTREPAPWWIAPDSSTRTYCCRECGKRWSVDAVQASRFDLAAIEPAALGAGGEAMRAAHFDDCAPRGMRGEREQLAAFLAAAAADLDSAGPGGLDLVEYIEIAGQERPRGEMIQARLLLS